MFHQHDRNARLGYLLNQSAYLIGFNVIKVGCRLVE